MTYSKRHATMEISHIINPPLHESLNSPSEFQFSTSSTCSSSIRAESECSASAWTGLTSLQPHGNVETPSPSNSPEMPGMTPLHQDRRVFMPTIAPGPFGSLFRERMWRIDKECISSGKGATSGEVKKARHAFTERQRRPLVKLVIDGTLDVYGLRQPGDEEAAVRERCLPLVSVLSQTSTDSSQNNKMLSNNQKGEINLRASICMWEHWSSTGLTLEDLTERMKSEDTFTKAQQVLLEACKKDPFKMTSSDASAVLPQDLEVAELAGCVVVGKGSKRRREEGE